MSNVTVAVNLMICLMDKSTLDKANLTTFSFIPFLFLNHVGFSCNVTITNK